MVEAPLTHSRTIVLRGAPPRTERDYVVYWMTAARRLRNNHGLDHALAVARDLEKPLLVVEVLSSDYPHASARLSRFVAEGMMANAKDAARQGFSYVCRIDSKSKESASVLERLGNKSAIWFTDHFPTRAYRSLYAAVLKRLPDSLPVHAIDANGLLPLLSGRTFTVAHSFRRHLHKEAMAGLPAPASTRPRCPPALKAKLPKWLASWDMSASPQAMLKASGTHPVVGEPIEFPGGSAEGASRTGAFLERLDGYPDRNQPDAEAASGLSPYLHFGHVSAEAIFHDLLRREEWDPSAIDPSALGKRGGFWGLSEGAESFVDELITWREVGFQFCHWNEDYDCFESLPGWAQESLNLHEKDSRTHIYSLEELERAETHDELWNAAQRQLVREGIIHNYLRMLWGKNILAWTPNAREALRVMEVLNNRYAIDGRDPNSYTGIMWVLGRFDRAWGPERPVFGKVRYMTSKSTRTKLRLKRYLAEFGEEASRQPGLGF